MFTYFYLLGELANLNDRKPEVVDPFERPDEADTVTTSTSVFVAQPGSDSSGKKPLGPPYLTVTSLVVVCFDQLLGAARTRRLVELLLKEQKRLKMAEKVI